MGILGGWVFLMSEVPLYLKGGGDVEHHAVEPRNLFRIERESSLLTTYWSESTLSS